MFGIALCPFEFFDREAFATYPLCPSHTRNLYRCTVLPLLCTVRHDLPWNSPAAGLAKLLE
jgi:hypothetical protein